MAAQSPKANSADSETAGSGTTDDPVLTQRCAIVVGSAMIDIIAIIAPDNIERMAMRNEGAAYLLLEQGRKVPADSISTHIGGGGCNVAVSLSRRRWRASVLAKTGRDLNAAAVREHLQKNDVNEDLLRASETVATGVSVMVASHDRNAAIFVHRGANEVLAPSDITDASFEGAHLIYIAPLSSGSADCFPQLVEQGRWAGAMVAANPGVRQLTSRAEAFFSAIGNLDLLSVNAQEAAALAPGLIARGAQAIEAERRGPAADEAPELFRRGLSFGGHDLALTDFFAGVHVLGPRWVLLTDGAKGAYLSSLDEPKDREGPRSLLYCPPAEVEVAGTAGAGDAFCSTLAAALAEGIEPEAALAQAAVNAANVVSYVNTTDGLLDADTLAKRAAAEKLEVRRLA